MKSYFTVLCSTLLFACANTQSPEDAQAMASYVGGLLKDAASKEIDKNTRINNMEVSQKLGNTVSLRVSYGNLYKPDGVVVQVKALDNGVRIPGIQSTIGTPGSINGGVDLALTWKDARLGRSLRSNQITVEFSRDGNVFKSRTFELTKQWTALTEPDADSPQSTATATSNPSPLRIPPIYVPLRPAKTTVDTK
ncbi:MAG: hypothetical protein HY080_02840 [Gammaproteobacteria bacterium]|nr:hypothetical protein [Gammaproteobacteria bacterium]